MEQKWRFGLVLGRLAVLKKDWGQLQETFEGIFFMFSLFSVVFFDIVAFELKVRQSRKQIMVSSILPKNEP